LLEAYRPFTLLGLALIIVGIVLVMLPTIVRHVPTLEKLERLPPILVYVYRHDNFYLITSPILILVGLAYFAYLLWKLLR